MINVAVLGYGTVGSGVVEVINTNNELISRRVGDKVDIKYVLDIRDFPGDPIQEKIVKDFSVIENDPDVDIVVEVMGGVDFPFGLVSRALRAGKSVCTSNKALVAAKGNELLQIARENHVSFLFEASVGGGIPIIRPLYNCMTADYIETIIGILNGTTNYMLTKMFYEGADYDTVLKEAQANGYAERNPEADVEGYDACRKLAILSSIISEKFVNFEEIYTEGITKVTTQDMLYAKKLGATIKLLAMAKQDGSKLQAMVAPHILKSSHPLYSVNDVFNAIFVHGNMLGDAMFYGSGAGKLPTASAVVGDVVDAARHLHKTIGNNWSSQKLVLEPIEETSRQYFVRMTGSCEEMKAAVEAAFGPAEYLTVEELPEEFGFVTGVITEGRYNQAAAGFDNIISMIRVEA